MAAKQAGMPGKASGSTGKALKKKLEWERRREQNSEMHEEEIM